MRRRMTSSIDWKLKRADYGEVSPRRQYSKKARGIYLFTILFSISRKKLEASMHSSKDRLAVPPSGQLLTK